LEESGHHSILIGHPIDRNRRHHSHFHSPPYITSLVEAKILPKLGTREGLRRGRFAMRDLPVNGRHLINDSAILLQIELTKPEEEYRTHHYF